ncbi:hypothetical protein AHIS1636_24420 [Arthrobacter mangrovi]|uniref:Uncharacterized protein n=1 Tax=Arthrobacter mangrovi TaxID=2966350 RepID=A0ABQ5MVI1_9MICC|nr:hypothetical protein AHIS1636_24420 [Arthrobacter mangrovi]
MPAACAGECRAMSSVTGVIRTNGRPQALVSVAEGVLRPLGYQRHKHRLRRAPAGRQHRPRPRPDPLDTRPMNINENDLAIWRNLWTDGAGLAVHARRFMENHLQANAVR